MPHLPWTRRPRDRTYGNDTSKRVTVNSKYSEKSQKTATSSRTGSSNSVPPAPWKALFLFTTREHLPALICGLVSAVTSGISSPAQSLLIGKAFGLFTTYGAGAISGSDLLKQETNYVTYMLAVGAGTWLVRFIFFASWLAFGELQAKSARDRLFTGLLHKDIAWYDQRRNGVGALIPRIQT